MWLHCGPATMCTVFVYEHEHYSRNLIVVVVGTSILLRNWDHKANQRELFSFTDKRVGGK